MFNIKLYTFNKRENSTARPLDTSAVSFQCKLLKECGLINPTIELNIGLSEAPTYNYAYIEDFNRYYFIEEWTNVRPLWRATLRVDVLATYKNNIGSENLYVLRSSAEYDGNIIDAYYSAKTNITNSRSVLTRLHNKRATLGEGGYIVGLISADKAAIPNLNAQYGSIRYEYITRDALNIIVERLTDINYLEDILDFNVEGVSMEFAKSIADPLQYIKSCLWVPYELSASIVPTPLNLYGWTLPAMKHLPVSNLQMINTETMTVSIPKHPSTNSRGNYVNVSPNTNLWLDLAPYGIIQLDTSITANVSEITLKEDLDLLTGKAVLSILANGVVIDKHVAQLGVSIQLSQVSRDSAGMARASIQMAEASAKAAAGAYKAVATLGILGVDDAIGGASGIAGGIVNAVEAYAPKSKSLGGGGGFVDIYQEWSINAQFFNLTEDDNAHVGRPLYQNRVINTLSGFIMVKDGSIALPATAEESRLVRSYLERGFYYE